VKPTKKRIAKALDAFEETIPSFCEAALPNGVLANNKWHIGDLSSGEAGTSCCVFLNGGGFCDQNPSADHVKGGKTELWAAIFGVTDLGEIIVGMEAWVKDGTLPDGSKGVMRAVKIETESGKVLTARDRDEVKLIELIDYHQQKIEYWKRDVTVKPEDEFLAEVCPESMCAGWPESRRTEFKEDALRLRADMIRDIPKFEERIEESKRFIGVFKSKLYRHRWRKAVNGTQANRDEIAQWLADLRGLGPDVFAWLIDLVLSKTWTYTPKRIPVQPQVIGDVATADRVIVAESTWDPIAYLDEHRLYKEDGWAVVITRGARTAKLFPAELVKPEAAIIALAQNDAANAQWLKELTQRVPGREVTIIQLPAECKDYNDYVTALYRERNKI
jgi:hypothetical protein